MAVLTTDGPLGALRADCLATSTPSMPIAGIIFWTVVAVAGMLLPPRTVAFVVGFGSGAIFPLAILIDKLRGRTLIRSTTSNPVTGMFLQSLATVGLLWPFVIAAAIVASDPRLVVLGGAILMGIVWIPYGWAADDPTGLQHAIAVHPQLRCVPARSTALHGVRHRVCRDPLLRVLADPHARPARRVAAARKHAGRPGRLAGSDPKLHRRWHN